MKKILFLILLIPISVYAAFEVNSVANPAKVNSVANPAKVNSVTACSEYYAFETGQDSGNTVGRTDDNERGGVEYTPAAEIDVCRVDFYINNTTGDISDKDFFCEIWSMTGSALNERQGVSAEVDGSNIADGGVWVTWTFSTPVNNPISTEHSYHLKMVADAAGPDAAATYDGSNYITIGIDDENNTQFGFSRWAEDDKTRTMNDAEDDVLMRINSQ